MINLLKSIHRDLPVTLQIKVIACDETQIVRFEISQFAGEWTEEFIQRHRIWIAVHINPAAKHFTANGLETSLGFVDSNKFMFIRDMVQSTVETECPAMVFTDENFFLSRLLTNEWTTSVSTGVVEGTNLIVSASNN